MPNTSRQISPVSIPALMAPPPARDNPLTRSIVGVLGICFLGLMLAACLLTLPYTMGTAPNPGTLPAENQSSLRFDLQDRFARHIPPSWISLENYGPEVDPLTLPDTPAARRHAVAMRDARLTSASDQSPSPDQLAAARPYYLMGTDLLGRSVLVRCLAGGGISLGIGLVAAFLSVMIGTLYGALSGYIGGRTDAVMMRIVDILYGLPYILLVVLLAVAVDAQLDDWVARRASAAAEQRTEFIERALQSVPPEDRANQEVRQRIEGEAMVAVGSGELSEGRTQVIGIVTLLVAIGGVSWLTMARVVRGQVLSLKAQPFMEAARAMGVGVPRQFFRHLLPNLVGPIVVYATLTVPQAILQESFLSFLGIGVRPPVPSWGNLAADGLVELNRVRSNWWLLLFPCLLLGSTLLALNFVGEGLREALDPKRARQR